jgi:hypothetical protein
MFSNACRKHFAARSFALSNQTRNSGGYLKKNSHVEENSGLREISYWTWGFSETSMSRFLAYLIIPGVMFYSLVESEFVSESLHAFCFYLHA